MARTWEELVADVTVRHPLRCRQSRHLRVPAGSVEPTPVKESKMFGMPCLKRENGKVVAGYWKDGGLTVKLVDEAHREAALALPGAQLFDPTMGASVSITAQPIACSTSRSQSSVPGTYALAPPGVVISFGT